MAVEHIRLSTTGQEPAYQTQACHRNRALERAVPLGFVRVPFRAGHPGRREDPGR